MLATNAKDGVSMKLRKITIVAKQELQNRQRVPTISNRTPASMEQLLINRKIRNATN